MFGLIENGLWRSKRKPRRKEEEQPRLKTGSCCLMERQEQEGEAVMEAGPPKSIPVLSTLALRRLEFLSPWGGPILGLHHSIFVVTRFPLDEPCW